MALHELRREEAGDEATGFVGGADAEHEWIGDAEGEAGARQRDVAGGIAKADDDRAARSIAGDGQVRGLSSRFERDNVVLPPGKTRWTEVPAVTLSPVGANLLPSQIRIERALDPGFGIETLTLKKLAIE